MPSRLKSLELQGYKTFANRTRFEFGARITAIVGPNGSGKSNIADALRWVLGEQSYALLRAQKTEDMIFSGSRQRPRAGLASVTVVFDNSAGWLPIDFSEVAITRRAARDGQNEYLLNGQRVRLRDIRELLGHAGLTEHTYTFIGQGLVDAALALRPEERRQMLEGAAGIGVYRHRREEALRRLESSQRNLERVQDLLAELEPRLRRLERQARRAREAAQIQADLELMLKEWYGFHWLQAQNHLQAARATAARQASLLEEATTQREQILAQVSALRERLNQQRQQLAAWHRDLAAKHRQLEALARDLAVLDERRRALQSRREEGLSEKERLQAQIRDGEERLQQAKAEVQEQQRALAEAQRQLAAASAALEALLQRRRAARRALEQAQQQVERLSREQAALEARLGEARRRAAQIHTDWQAAQEALPPLEQALQRAQEALRRAVADREQAEARRSQAEAAVAQAREAVRRAEQARTAARQELETLRAAQAALQARLRVLEEAEQNLVGYAEGPRWLLRKAHKHARLRGALGQHLRVPEALETAIAAALDRFTEAVVVEAPLPDAPLDLSARAPTRVALLPLPSLRPAAPFTPPDDPDVLGVAARLVEAPDPLRAAVDVLLGQVLVVRHRDAALRLLPALPPSAWVVTLQGEAFSPQGVVVGGKSTASSTLRRGREKRELQAQLQALEAQIRAQTDAFRQAEGQLTQAQAALQQAEAHRDQAEQEVQRLRQQERRAQQEADRAAQAWELRRREAETLERTWRTLQTEIARLEEEQAALQARVQQSRQTLQERQQALQALAATEAHAREAHWQTQVALAEQALAGAQQRLSERQRALDDARQRLAAQNQRLDDIARQLQALAAEHERLQAQAQALETDVRALQAQISPLQKAIEEDEAGLQALEQQADRAAQAVHIAERHHNQAQLALARAQEALETLRRRIEEDLGPVDLTYQPQVSGPQPLPLEGMVVHLPAVQSLPPDLEERIKIRRAQLRRLGPVNPEAEEEYQETRTRYEFLSSQLEDLQQADADIRQVIAELDGLMHRAFHKTYDVVNREFRAIFTRLFGGGSAQLILTDPDDVTRTGVEIEAHLPGKRPQRLAMLSGGERSLTAVALIFALLKASPTPFCVLDEVDAMLDEANVGRFRDLLVELSEHTQFLIITHNRTTVQAADVIYGVTLAPDATSQVMSLKLDDLGAVMQR